MVELGAEHSAITQCIIARVTRYISSDHENKTRNFCNFDDIKPLRKMLGFRENKLGQYIFIKASMTARSDNLTKRPIWLYRSYPDNQLI